MDRMKTFFKYALIVIICYFGSNTLIYAGINSIYTDISNYQYLDSNVMEVNINEAKSTSINGYVNGTVKNNSNSDIKEKYIKIDFYSKRDVNMGTKYIKIENLRPKDLVVFNINFKFSNVSYCVITICDEI